MFLGVHAALVLQSLYENYYYIILQWYLIYGKRFIQIDKSRLVSSRQISFRSQSKGIWMVILSVMYSIDKTYKQRTQIKEIYDLEVSGLWSNVCQSRRNVLVVEKLVLPKIKGIKKVFFYYRSSRKVNKRLHLMPAFNSLLLDWAALQKKMFIIVTAQTTW